MKKYLALILPTVLLFGCVSQGAKEKSFVEENPSVLVRNAHSMAYHSGESQVYFFGGANEKEVMSDLWLLDSTNWRKVEAKNGPEARTFAPLTFDSKNNRLILFGGSKVLFGKGPDPENLLNDTWQFKNNQWEKLITTDAPSPRAEAVMVYDESRETIVLFGGYHIQNGEYVKLGDTWEFRDSYWHLTATVGPSERHGVSMAYHAEDKSVILFGGSTVDKQYGEAQGETWEWNGESWNKFDIAQPTGMFNATMAYDKEFRELIRFGGWNGESRTNATWSFRDNKWRKLSTGISPIPRNHSAMVYDEKNKRIVLFGGHDGDNVFGDSWEYSNHEWKEISKLKPIERVRNGH